jgi:hypothetical protein
MMCRIPKFHSERQHGYLQIWVIRATIDVHVYKNVKHGSVSVKQRSGYVHQNVTEAVHATISDNKIKKLIIFSNNMSLFIKSYHPFSILPKMYTLPVTYILYILLFFFYNIIFFSLIIFFYGFNSYKFLC